MCISLIVYMTKLEVGIKQFCCVPKYDGFHKKTILFTRKVTWVIV